MRRLIIVLAGLAVLGAAAVLVTRSDEPGDYRVAAIFDTAKGMVAGQQVKIAGAVVGEVRDVELAPGPKARVVMEVDREFAPFRADASCRILPEGLISENFIECDPGSPGRAALASRGAGTPTVPVQRTAVPTALQDVINVFSLPVSQRLRVIFDQLGLATAGRGEDLNALLRRANPALAQSQRVLSIVEGQRRRIADAVGQTDRVLAELADRDRDVRGFVDRSAAVARTTAKRRRALGETVRRLPALLQAGRDGLRSLDNAMAQGTPLLRDLRAGAPAVRRLTTTLPAFARAGTPALRSLAAAADTGRTAVRSARPAVRHLKAGSAQARPFADHLEQLLTSTRDQGGLEGALRLTYSLSSSFSAYDNVSHMVGLVISLLPQCLADKKAPGCSSKYDAPGDGTIPPNDPSCGPVSGAPWDPPTDCRPGVPGLGLPTPGKAPVRAERRRTAPRAERPRRAPAPAAPRRPDAPRRPAPLRLPELKPLPKVPLPDVLGPRRPDGPGAGDESLLDFLLGP